MPGEKEAVVRAGMPAPGGRAPGRPEWPGQPAAAILQRVAQVLCVEVHGG